MMQHDLSKTVVVFDLDDTLYQEADYLESGLHEVCKWIKNLYGKDVFSDLEKIKNKGEKDLFAAITRLADLPLTVKDSLLWIYRLHTPTIMLRDEVRLLVQQLETICCAVTILTDGRSISQRKKLKSLGLSHLTAYISEEHNSTKPNSLRFECIMREFPAKAYFYVGDNPKKDFLSPNALGWKTVGLRGNQRNIHSQNCIGLPPENLPDFWIDRLEELPDFLC